MLKRLVSKDCNIREREEFCVGFRLDNGIRRFSFSGCLIIFGLLVLVLLVLVFVLVKQIGG